MPIAVFTSMWITSYFVLSIIGQKVLHTSELLTLLAALALAMTLGTFLIKARKRVGKMLSPDSLHEYITNTVFMYGTTEVAGLLYLASQSFKCIKNTTGRYDEYGGYEACGATIYPSMSISIMMVAALLYRLSILPLGAPGSEVSVEDLVSFRDLPPKLKFQMLALAVILCGNVFLFGQMEMSSASDFMVCITLSLILLVGVVLIVEFVGLLWKGGGGGGRGEGLTDEGGGTGGTGERGETANKIFDRMAGDFI